MNYERVSLKLDNIFKPIKINRSESLNKVVPEEGYKYVDLGVDC